MALKIRTVMTYPLNGSTVDFGITFEYLARKFVSVTLIGKDRKELVLNQDFRFTTKTQITTTRAWSPSDGYTMIEIRRFTSATDRLVDFSDGSILRAYDLNISQVQTLHVAEEARDLTADTIGVNNDGNLDARGRKIVNVGDATNTGDAVNLGQLQRWNESALNSANNAKASEDRAWQHRESARVSDEHATSKAGEAASSADWSKKWAVDPNVVEQIPGGDSLRSSKTYSEWAKGDAAAAFNWKEETRGFRDQAENSKNAAKQSEVNAKSSEERAILEANKLGDMNNLAASIKSAQGTGGFLVKWKGIHVFNGGWQATSNTNVNDLYRTGVWRDSSETVFADFVLERGTGTARAFMTLVYPANGDYHVKMDAPLLTMKDIRSMWEGSGAHADQWGVTAPLWSQVRDGARNHYFPIIKQKSYQSGADARAWHQGILVGGDGRNNWNIMSTDEGGNSLIWTYTWDGHLDAPNNRDFRVYGDGRHVVTGGSLGKNGRVWGLAYDGKYLDDYIRENWVGDVYWGGSRWVAHNGQYQDNVAGWGEGCAGVTLNNNGTVSGVAFRALWISFHDGKKRIVASQ